MATIIFLQINMKSLAGPHVEVFIILKIPRVLCLPLIIIIKMDNVQAVGGR